MDDDTIDLIRKLCTRAGMIMEDTSVEALTISADVNTIQRLVLFADAAHAISAIVAAAMVLSRSEDIPDAP
jgi:hypothetical protein